MDSAVINPPTMSPAETSVCQWLAQHHHDMVSALGTLVSIESGSTNIAGIRQVRDQLAEWLEQAGVQTERIDTETGHPALWGCVDSASAGPAVYLTGHMDTVFPAGTLEQRPFRTDTELERAYGPGVADMKAGLVMNVFVCQALQALQRDGQLTLSSPVHILFTPDEEVGSLVGRQLIQQYVAGAAAVFNAEPARMNGNVVTARKGGDTFAIDVQGRSAHAGVNHESGISAIEVLARLITRIHALTDYSQGITTNIGVIQGGQTSNTVADAASAKLDVRFTSLEQRNMLHQQLQHCIDSHGVTGATATLTHLAGFLPFEADLSTDLFACYQQQAARLGIEVHGEFTGGCSDAGWTSAMGIPTLCGTGPIGGWAHTDREYCETGSLVSRAQMLALTVISGLDLA